MSKSLSTIIAVFLGIGVLMLVGGMFFAYVKNTQSPADNGDVVAPPPAQNDASPRQSATLSAEEKERLLNAPDSRVASEAELAAYSELISRYARERNTLDVTNCDPDPFVFRVPHGSTFTVTNAGEQSHVVYLGRETAVAPGQSVSITADFGPGIIGYLCDGNGPAGLVQVYAPQ